MTDIEIGYKGSTIASMSSSGSLTLDTAGTYCEDNITVTYDKVQGSAFTPATTISVTPTISIDSSGLITANNSGTSSITPTVTAGYITSGTAGTITVDGSNTSQLVSQAASTWTPTTTSQIISSGTYLTGNQTIAGDSNLLASNIASGVSIFGVTGTYSPQPSLESIAVDTTYFPSQSTTIEDGWIGTQIFEELTQTMTNDKNIAYSTYRSSLKQCFFSSFTGNTHYKVYGQFELKWANNDTEIYTININDWNYNVSLGIYCEIPFTWSGSGRSQTFNRMELLLAYGQYIGVYLYGSNNITDTVTWTSNNYLSLYTIGYDGYESITINLMDNPQFLKIYKSLAYHSIITSSAPGVSEWCNSLSSFSTQQFAGQPFSGDFTFNNIKSINYYTFGSVHTGTQTGTWGYFGLNFPSCSSIYTAAFAVNLYLQSVSFPECTSIGNSAFWNCGRLITISFPECTTIGQQAFQSCYSLTTASFPKCTFIGYYAFQGCSRLTTASFPECITISNSAFQNCINLTTISFPECITISNYAFLSCSSLTTASFPKCTTIGSSAFYNCINLTTISFPKCTFINFQAFQYCSSLTTASFPECITISNYAFSTCSSLTTASFPKCTTIGSSAFYKCINLTTISFPKCTSIGQQAFQSCTSLTTVSFPECTTIGPYAFSNCQKLESTYFMGSSIPSVGQLIFTNTPIANSTYLGYYGSIYVPASLLADYKTATNWATYSNRMVGI